MASIAAFLAIGTISLSTNANTVAAKTRHIYVQSTKQQNHYIKLANRPGTHYFKGYKVTMAGWGSGMSEDGLDEYGNDGALTYKMNGQVDHDYTATDGIEATIIGTKSIGNKHFFISKVDGEKTLVLARNFAVPTMYRLKKGHHITEYKPSYVMKSNGVYGNVDWKHLRLHSIGYHEFNHKYKFAVMLVLSPKVESGRVWYNGEAYRPISDDGNGWFIKEKDIKKDLKKATGYVSPSTSSDRFSGNRILHENYDD